MVTETFQPEGFFSTILSFSDLFFDCMYCSNGPNSSFDDVLSTGMEFSKVL